MRTRAIHQLCRTILATIPIPDPFEVHVFCEGVAAVRGRPIELRSMTMPTGGPSGMWIATGIADFILYEQDTTALHQDHIVMHEMGHLLAEHNSATLIVDLAPQLLPHLDPQLVSRVLHRTAYKEVEERIAETLASRVLGLANRWRPVSEWEGPPEAAGLRRRVHLTIETTQ